ncbi:MAG: RHS repeat-associated core domain-containing protein [Kiritimatiellia bacterium]
MRFDSMGRRAEYLETTADEDLIITNKHQYFVYDGYLCLQIVNAQTGVAEYAFEWNPTEPRSGRKRPRNKNVSELVYYQRARGVAAHYEYAPFGAVTVQTRGDGWGTLDFSALNPFRFSSEFADDTLGLVYYNYRHYEPLTGRWLRRDPIGDFSSVNCVAFNRNYVFQADALGLLTFNPYASVL